MGHHVGVARSERGRREERQWRAVAPWIWAALWLAFFAAWAAVIVSAAHEGYRIDANDSGDGLEWAPSLVLGFPWSLILFPDSGSDKAIAVALAGAGFITWLLALSIAVWLWWRSVRRSHHDSALRAT